MDVETLGFISQSHGGNRGRKERGKEKHKGNYKKEIYRRKPLQINVFIRFSNIGRENFNNLVDNSLIDIRDFTTIYLYDFFLLSFHFSAVIMLVCGYPI